MMCAIGHTALLLHQRTAISDGKQCSFLGFFLFFIFFSTPTKSTVAQTSGLRGEINQPSSGWVLPPTEHKSIRIQTSF